MSNAKLSQPFLGTIDEVPTDTSMFMQVMYERGQSKGALPKIVSIFPKEVSLYHLVDRPVFLNMDSWEAYQGGRLLGTWFGRLGGCFFGKQMIIEMPFSQELRGISPVFRKEGSFLTAPHFKIEAVLEEYKDVGSWLQERSARLRSAEEPCFT